MQNLGKLFGFTLQMIIRPLMAVMVKTINTLYIIITNKFGIMEHLKEAHGLTEV